MLRARRPGRQCEPKRRVKRGTISEGDLRIAEHHPVRMAASVFHIRAGRFFLVPSHQYFTIPPHYVQPFP